jgi:putative SbcD/Mre11-related phosphoesterase
MKFIKDTPALLLEDIGAVVIADLHIGLEYALFRSGVRIPNQTGKMKARVLEILKETGAEKLMVLGDVKHAVPETSFQERREIPEFFAGLAEMAEVHVSPGNHDSNLDELLPRGVKLHGTEGFMMGKHYLSHGHTWPSKDILEADDMVVGHVHPTVEFKDSYGYRILRPVFLKGRMLKEKIRERYGVEKSVGLVALPTFNDLFSGVPIKSSLEANLLGPVFRNGFVDVDECEAYLLDGTFVGKVKDIQT